MSYYITMLAKPLTREHQEMVGDLLPLGVLWLVFSWSFVALSGMFEWGRVDHFIQWLLVVFEEATKYGIVNIWTPYPQTTNLLFYQIYLLADKDPFLFWLSFKMVNIVSNLIVIASVYYIARKLYGRNTARWSALFFTFLYAPIYFSVLINFVYDPIPVAILMLALCFLVKGRLAVFSLLVGIGGGMKIFPLLGLVAVGWYLLTKRRFLDIGKCVIASLVGLSPLFALFALNPPIFMSTYRWQMGRPPNESMYNLVFWLMKAPYVSDPQYYSDSMVHSPWPPPRYGPAIRARPISPISRGRHIVVSSEQDTPVRDVLHLNVSLEAPDDAWYRLGLQTVGLFTNGSGPPIYTFWKDLKKGEEFIFTSYHEVWPEWMADSVWVERGFVSTSVIQGNRATANTSMVRSFAHPTAKFRIYINVTLRAPDDGQFRMRMKTVGLDTSAEGHIVGTPWIGMQADKDHLFILDHPLWVEPVMDKIWVEQAGVGTIDTLSVNVSYVGEEIDRVTVIQELYRLFESYMNIGVTPSPRILHQPVKIQPSSEWPVIVESQVSFLCLVAVIIFFVFMRLETPRDVLASLLFLFCATFALSGQCSPQYLLWVLPLLLLWRPKWTGALISLVLVTIVGTEYPLSFEGYQLSGLQSFVWTFWLSILLRTATFVAICAIIWFSLRPTAK